MRQPHASGNLKRLSKDDDIQGTYSDAIRLVLAGAGLWLQKRWTMLLAVVIAAATALTFGAFGLHIYCGRAYEQRTVIALSLRTLVGVMIAVVAWRGLVRRMT